LGILLIGDAGNITNRKIAQAERRIAINSLLWFSGGFTARRIGPWEFCFRPFVLCSLSCFRYENRTFLRSLRAISAAAKDLCRQTRV